MISFRRSSIKRYR